MRKKWIAIFILFVVSLFFLVSCGKQIEKNDGNNEDEFFESLSSSIQEIEESTFEEVIKAEEDKIVIENERKSSNFLYGPFEHLERDFTYLIDLNGDNANEIIYFSFVETDKTITPIFTINNKDYSDIFNEEVLEYFYIVDVDKDDNFKEIVFGIESDDTFTSKWYRFNEEKLIFIGLMPILPDDEMYFEDGKIILYEKIDIIEPNFVEIIYEIQNDKFVEIKEEIYLFKISYKRDKEITNKEDLIVRKEMDKKAEKFTIPKESTLEFVGIDKNSWVSILYDGEEYFLYVKDKKLLDNKDIEISSMFENLIGN